MANTPATSAPRLAPEMPLPPYSFVPGQSPHPRSDPAGHSFGTNPAPPAPLDLDHWQTSKEYLHGLDLFNAQFYWESHEQIEALWLACGRRGIVADFLKGLIKLAAAGVKYRQGSPEGTRSHARRAAELWRGVARSPGGDVFLGLRLQELVDLAEGVDRQGWPPQPPTLLPGPAPS